MPVNVVAVHDLSAGYHSNEVLHSLSFDVKRGNYVGVVGPNGSGKSTLMKTILGILLPFSGQVRLFGKPIPEFHDWWRIGYLPQKPLSLNFMFPATVKEIVSLGLLSRKSFPKRFGRSDEKRIAEVLAALQILPIKDVLVGELSGGQQQRVLAARAIVSEPELLVLDEPGTALDPGTRVKFMEMIRDLNKNKKVTILHVTHDLANIGSYADKLLYVDRKIVFYGTFHEVCESEGLTEYFGEYLQHLICHQHNNKASVCR